MIFKELAYSWRYNNYWRRITHKNTVTRSGCVLIYYDNRR
jgi:hypothetical protein